MLTATDPSNTSPVGLEHHTAGGHKPLAVLLILGVVIGLCDVATDSIFIAQAYWLDFVEKGQGASQSELLIPYIAVSVRAMFYLAVVSEALRLNRSVKRRIKAISEALDRGAVVLLACVAGCILNFAATLFVVWDTAFHVVGMRGESFAPVVSRLATTDLSPLSGMAVASIIADAILIVLAFVAFYIVRSEKLRSSFGLEPVVA